MPSLLIEAYCPRHGIERYRIKVIKKFNIKSEEIIPKFRTKPTQGLSAIIIGKNVGYDQIKDYALRYVNETLAVSIINIKLIK